LLRRMAAYEGAAAAPDRSMHPLPGSAGSASHIGSARRRLDPA
jgi:hypothetical protein